MFKLLSFVALSILIAIPLGISLPTRVAAQEGSCDKVSALTLEEVRKFEAENLVWSPAENQLGLILSNSNEILVKDVESDEIVQNFEILGRPYIIRFSPDGKYIANLSDFWIEVWSLESGENIVSIDFDTLNPDESHYGIASGLTWRLDSTKLAFTYDYKAAVLDLATKEVTIIPQEKLGNKPIISVAWHPNFEQLALYASVASIIILDIATFDIVKELSWDSDDFGLPYWYGGQSLAWNQDGQKLAVISYHPTNFTILIWNMNTNEILTRLPNCDSVITSIAWNPRTDALAVGYTTDSLNKLGKNMVRIWNTEKYTVVADTLIDGGGPVLLAWNLKGNYLATISQDNLAQIWKFQD